MISSSPIHQMPSSQLRAAISKAASATAPAGTSRVGRTKKIHSDNHLTLRFTRTLPLYQKTDEVNNLQISLSWELLEGCSSG